MNLLHIGYYSVSLLFNHVNNSLFFVRQLCPMHCCVKNKNGIILYCSPVNDLLLKLNFNYKITFYYLLSL